jgi:transposase
MKPADFRAFLAMCKERGLSELQVATMIGCGKNSITRWKRYPAPTHIALAIAALEAGIEPWKRK